MLDKKEIISYIVVALVTVAIIGAFIYSNGRSGGEAVEPVATSTSSTTPPTGKYDDFAKCVASKGLTMYGAVWCSHCKNEKKNFGDSFRFIKYVECPDNIKLCTDLGINGFPTWIDAAGKKYEGEQGLAGLAKITGCEQPN